MPIPKPKKDEKQIEFISRCMGNETMNKEYPDQKQRSAICYTSWRDRGKKSNMKLNTITLQINKISTKIISFEGKSHLVAPVVLMVEGVHTGGNGIPIYYSRNVLQENYWKWNGIPVPVFHPQAETENGSIFISAQDPKVLEENNVGRLFNTSYVVENNLGKLKAELYIDIEKANSVYPSLISQIQAGKKIEVSTGLFDDDIIQPGEWNEEKYDITATNIRPDHLALLPGMEGACNWKDGCGVRANRKGEKDVNQRELREAAQKVNMKISPILIDNSISDSDIREEIRLGMSEKVKGEYYIWLKSVYQQDGYFIYEREEKTVDGSMGKINLYKRSFSLNDSGVEIKDDAIEVKERTDYIEVPNTQQASKKGENMAAMYLERINKIIANSSIYTEENRKWLSTLDDCPLSKIEALVSQEQKAKEQELKMKELEINLKKLEDDSKKGKEPDPPITNQPTVPVPQPIPAMTLDQYLAQAPPELQGVLLDGINLRNQKKADLIKTILANQANAFSEEGLKAMEIPLLEGIARVAAPSVMQAVNYFGRSGVQGNPTNPIPTLEVMSCFKSDEKGGQN